MVCVDCRAPLEPDDGHDLCPSCLGIGHLKQGLTDQACANCTCLSLATRAARLAQLEGQLASCPPPAPRDGSLSPRAPKRPTQHPRKAPSVPKRKKVDPLVQRVDTLTSEFAEIKALLYNLQPPQAQPVGGPAIAALQPSPEQQPPVLSPAGEAPEDDVLSTRASVSLNVDDWGGERVDVSHDSEVHSSDTGLSSLRGSVVSHTSVVRPAVKLALARLGLDAAPAELRVQNPFFRQASASVMFTVPPSAPFISELQRCWADPRRFSHLSGDCRALASMQDASSHGLDRMPTIEPALAALIVSPDEALRPDARCPRPQCRLTDDFIGKSYDAAARAARIGNSLSHLILAQSQALQSSGVDPSLQSLSEASLQAFAFMSRELGRLMASLTLARRQIWLAQSPLSEPCRRALRSLPVVPGQLFGAAAQQALERTLQVTQARQQFASLNRAPARLQRPTVAPAATPPIPRPIAQGRAPFPDRPRQPSGDRPFRQARRDAAPNRSPPKGRRGRGRRQ